MVTTFLSEQDKLRVSEAIKDAETTTSGEIVAVVARASDGYHYVPLLWASGLTLLTPMPILISPLPLTYQEIYTIQLTVFIIFGLLLRLVPLKMRLVPNAVKVRRSARHARQQFFEQGLHLTEGRTGILLFVSVAERYVEVLADSGINDRVQPAIWEDLVTRFIKQVKQGDVANGFLTAIETCGRLLAEHVPAEGKNRDELLNHLIEV